MNFPPGNLHFDSRMHFKNIILISRIAKTPAPLFIEPLQDRDIVEGKEARMMCRVRATPRPMIEWLKDGRNFKEDYNTYTEFDGSYCTLVIKKVRMDQDGIYECLAKNKEGSRALRQQRLLRENSVVPYNRFHILLRISLS